MPLPTKLSAIVAENSLLRQLFREAAKQQVNDSEIKSCISESMRSHVRFALVRDETLILIADSPAWASKLRYQVAQIHEQVCKLPNFPRVRSIRVKVFPAAPPPARVDASPAERIGAAAAASMQRQAESFADPKLREAIDRLSQRRKPDHES
jgi:hypothetical protein